MPITDPRTRLPDSFDRKMVKDSRHGGHDPEFQVHSIALNGLIDSHGGLLSNPWFDPEQDGA